MKKYIIILSSIFTVFSITMQCYAQSTVANGGIGNVRVGGYFLGWDGTGGSSGSLEIRNDFAQPINFFTSTTQKATILSNGNVGIGTPSPSNLLTVAGGNIDISSGNKQYLISNTPVLWHGGTTSNIYVGVTGVNATNTGTDNTFVGNSAGSSITIGYSNTCIGSYAGQDIEDSKWNVCVGYQAGFSLKTTWGSDNTFVGHDAGYSTNGGTSTVAQGNHNSFYGDESGYFNTIGNNNTAIGSYAMHQNTTGNYIVCLGFSAGYANTADDNTFIGYLSGAATTSGTNNTFLGIRAGNSNITGQKNTFLGANSNCGVNNLINASAIGANAVVMTDNSMILGDPDVKTGIGLSGITPGPQDKLEINSGTGCTSGLQFRQLLSSCSTTSNPGPGVLSVDNSGKVIYVPDNGGGTLQTADNGLSVDATFTNVQLGNPIGNTTAQLIQNSEIPMNNFNLVFSDPSSGRDAQANCIGLGIITPAAKWHVKRTLSSVNLIASPVAALVENHDLDLGLPNTGSAIGLSVITSNTNSNNYGLKSDVYGARTNYAGYFTSIVAGNGANYGSFFEASNATGNYAVMGYAPSGLISPANYAIYGNAPNPNFTSAMPNFFNVAVYGTAPANPAGVNFPPGSAFGSWAGYFNGDLAYTGTLWNLSDSTLKTNIQPYSGASILLDQLQVHSYYFDTAACPGQLHLPMQQQYGLLAQELETVAPSLVLNTLLPMQTDSSGNLINPAMPVKMINMTGLIPVIIQGMKEKQQEIDSLRQRLTLLENAVSACCSLPSGGNTGHRTQIKLTEIDQQAILYQNEPNPFSEKTIIRYFIPETVKNASLVFYNSTGVRMKEVILNQKGDGQAEVETENITDGIYSYSLIVDGKNVDTKRMIKTK